MPSNTVFRPSVLLSLAAILCPSTILAQAASNALLISNPNWNITITDAGYSDYLLDNTPGSVGREYLSGEWGAAVSYNVGAAHVAPTWLEPNFVFPDWQTNSNFTTLSPIVGTATGYGDLTTAAASTIANPHLRVNIAYQMLDTVVGVKIGASPASAATGSSIDSNRYVLQQTYTITNTTNETITGLNVFQFLHGLNGVDSVYDNRNYGGALSAYRYHTTQQAVDASQVVDGSGTTFRDYIGFKAQTAPVAFDNGYYGIDTVDNHGIGKPSVGVHWAVEGDSLANVDSFHPSNLWVGGAQKYDLGTLAAGASRSIDVLLAIRTGTVIPTTSPGSGCDVIANGGPTYAGGVRFQSASDLTGTFYAEYDDNVEQHELQEMIAAGELQTPNFAIPGALQLYQLEYDGDLNDATLLVTLGYNAALLPPDFAAENLKVYHYKNGHWSEIAGTVDALANTITFETDSLSPFALGDATAVPEPSAFALLGVTAVALAFAGRQRRQTR